MADRDRPPIGYESQCLENGKSFAQPPGGDGVFYAQPPGLMTFAQIFPLRKSITTFVCIRTPVFSASSFT